MMRNPALLLRRRFRGPDVEFPISRNRIAIHDLAAKFLSQRERQGGLAAARRAKNYQEQRIAGQSARTPVHVAPEASDGNGKYEQHDYDCAKRLKTLAAPGTQFHCTTRWKWPGHGFIVAEAAI
jgi:hypothetical protein